METTFSILLNVKTCNGYETYGKFFIGNNRKAALDIWKMLKGNAAVNDGTILHMELMETAGNIPVNIYILGCTLEQITENTKIITKETFKLFSLKTP
jgi:hypothetical protein